MREIIRTITAKQEKLRVCQHESEFGKLNVYQHIEDGAVTAFVSPQEAFSSPIQSWEKDGMSFFSLDTSCFRHDKLDTKGWNSLHVLIGGRYELCLVARRGFEPRSEELAPGGRWRLQRPLSLTARRPGCLRSKLVKLKALFEKNGGPESSFYFALSRWLKISVSRLMAITESSGTFSSLVR